MTTKIPGNNSGIFNIFRKKFQAAPYAYYRFDANFLDRIAKILAVVHWVHIHQNESGQCAGELCGYPFIFVRRPNAQPIALFHAQMKKPKGKAFTLLT
jgi:hypothetical protein